MFEELIVRVFYLKSISKITKNYHDSSQVEKSDLGFIFDVGFLHVDLYSHFDVTYPRQVFKCCLMF